MTTRAQAAGCWLTGNDAGAWNSSKLRRQQKSSSSSPSWLGWAGLGWDGMGWDGLRWARLIKPILLQSNSQYSVRRQDFSRSIQAAQ